MNENPEMDVELVVVPDAAAAAAAAAALLVEVANADGSVVLAGGSTPRHAYELAVTIPALESGAHVVFPAVGADKAPAVRRPFAEQPLRTTPASLVRARSGTTTVILDAAAASLLG